MRTKIWEIIALSALVIGVIAAVAFPIVAGDIFIPEVGEENVRTVVIRVRAQEMGGFSPSEVVVNQGKRVKLLFYTEDLVHTFELPEYDIMLDLHPGTWHEFEFTADKAGEFSFFCGLYCSPLHAFMRGKLNVIPAS